VLPQLVLGIWFDLDSAAVVEALRTVSTSNGAGPERLDTLLAPALGWASRLAIYLGALITLLLSCYFGLVHVAVAELRGGPAPGPLAAFLAGLRSAVPKGLLLVGIVILLMAVGQILIAPAILVAVLSLAVPVILVAEQKGLWRSLGDALTMKWARRSGVSGWAVLFHMLVLAATAYSALAVIGLLTIYGTELDRFVGVGRTFWTWTFGTLPFGPAYVLASLVETALSMAVIGMLPALTATLYFTVSGRRELGRV
jgi:hypothetical protein